MFTQSDLMQYFARLVVIFTTLPIHECAHGWMAHKLGDDTAARQGRLTLNPLAHIDPYGGILLFLTGFGWARPVPVNPYNFDRKRTVRGGMALTAAAGPLANILLALVLLALFKVLRIGVYALHMGAMFVTLLNILSMMISINVSLAVFNLLPVPPLDGYNVASYFLPAHITEKLARNSQIIFLVLLLVLWFTPILNLPISIITGLIYRLLDAVTFFLDIPLHLMR